MINSSKDNAIEILGEVIDILPGGKYKVKLIQGHVILARVSGKMRMFSIKIVVGDKVKVKISPYDLSKGRIIYRDK